MLLGINFCPTASFANASKLKKQSLRSCCSFVYLHVLPIVPVLHAGYLRYYTALSQFVQFVEDSVRHFEYLPTSCLVP